MAILHVIYEIYNLVEALCMCCDLYSHQNIDLSRESFLRGKPVLSAVRP